MLCGSSYCRIIVRVGMLSLGVLSCFLSHRLLLELLETFFFFADRGLLIVLVLFSSPIINKSHVSHVSYQRLVSTTRLFHFLSLEGVDFLRTRVN